jgi:hypothetical protein
LTDGNIADAILIFETLINSYADSMLARRAKLVLDDCALSSECAFILDQIKAQPPGGGQIFYPNMPDAPPN